MDVTVVGQLARDLILVMDSLPAQGNSGAVTQRREQLGGKGANQAVALAQLGTRPALVAVTGDDPVADMLLEQARADGIDVSAVIRRPGTPTGLIVEVLEDNARWRYLEHLPGPVLLSAADIAAAGTTIESAAAVLIQLQQPAEAVLAAARRSAEAGALVVLDGAPPDDIRGELLALADVLRADATEAKLLTGVPVDEPERLAKAALELVETGPRVAALAFDGGNLFAWRGPGPDTETLTLPLGDETVVDTTGGGDAFIAALTVGLLRGDPVPDAARLAAAASGATVGHPGGRPDLRQLA